jgi:hypothetical protein
LRVRDRTLTAALLAEVPRLDFGRRESQITQDLILHLGFVPHVSLLHGRPTMTESGGFSWCPATLDDMPIDLRREFGSDEKDRTLAVEGDGAVIGDWYARPVARADVRKRRPQPHGSDTGVVVKVDSALLDWKSCLILYQGLDADGPAHLVTTIEVCRSEDDDPIIDCRYVGAVRDFHMEERGIINISKWEDDDIDFRDDDDGDDYNNFSMFTIRLGNDGGRDGVRSWDILKSAWKLKHDESEVKSDGDEV